MLTRQISGREAHALKLASQQLVEAAGGVKAAAELTQASASRMSEAVSPWHDNRWLTLVQVADLEAVSGQPVITRALASMAGFALAPTDPARPQDMHQVLAHIVLETSDVTTALSAAMADGKVDAREAATVKAEAQGAIIAMQQLIAQCDHLMGPASVLREVK